jgi:hypothetical protein
MLQRIQTIFLLLACSAMLIACATSLGSFTYNGDRMMVEAVGVYLNGELHHFTWGLVGIGVISAVLSFVSIFFYRKRKLQIRLSKFNICLMVAFYLYFCDLIYELTTTGNLQFVRLGAGTVMPAVAILFVVLAIRRISADEALVRSLDRLR